jgi:hypothetical protein
MVSNSAQFWQKHEKRLPASFLVPPTPDRDGACCEAGRSPIHSAPPVWRRRWGTERPERALFLRS